MIISLLRHVLAVFAAELLARNAVLIPIQLGVAFLVGGDSLSAVLERRAVLGPRSTSTQDHESTCSDGSYRDQPHR